LDASTFEDETTTLSQIIRNLSPHDIVSCLRRKDTSPILWALNFLHIPIWSVSNSEYDACDYMWRWCTGIPNIQLHRANQL